MNSTIQIPSKKLTPFEKAQDNASYYVAHSYLMVTVQDVVKTWQDNSGAWKMLDWKNDHHDRSTLKEIMKEQRMLGDALISAANKFEKFLGISA